MARKQPQMLWYRASAIVGCILLGIAAVGMLWMLFGQHTGSSGPSVRWFQPAGNGPTPESEQQLPVLQAHGIILAHPSANAMLSQQEAVFIAGQREPDATSAQKVVARYELVNANTVQLKFTETPAWIIWYQNIASSTGGGHDLYVILNANSGTELFALRT